MLTQKFLRVVAPALFCAVSAGSQAQDVATDTIDAAFDVLGIQFGDGFDDVSQKLQASGKGYAIDSTRAALPVPDAEPFRLTLSAKVGDTVLGNFDSIRGDRDGVTGDWVLALFSGPPAAERVMRLTRDVKYEKGEEPAYDQLVGMLVERFGQPQMFNEWRSQSVLLWAHAPDGSALSQRQAATCNLSNITVAHKMINARYALSSNARACGEVLRVYISRAIDPGLVTGFQASIYNEAAKAHLDQATAELVSTARAKAADAPAAKPKSITW